MLDLDHSPDLVFVHLSDIHFRKGRTGDAHDGIMEIRHELEADLRTVNGKLPKIGAIVVSGDIAFGGQPEEFEYAASWLTRIRELVDCPGEGIMVIPGNHDVDRGLVPKGGTLDKLHEKIRGKKTVYERDEALAEALRDGSTGTEVLSSHKAYNDFADKYGCAISAQWPFWEKNFPLGFDSTLRFRGIALATRAEITQSARPVVAIRYSEPKSWIEIVSSPVWLEDRELELRSRIFLLAQALSTWRREGALLAAYAFSEVFIAIRHRSLSKENWDRLEPSLGWRNVDRDRSDRLVTAVVSRFVNHEWPTREFLSCFSTPDELALAAKEAARTWSGRSYLRSALKLASMGELGASNEVQQTIKAYL